MLPELQNKSQAFEKRDLKDLKKAKKLLEQPTIIARTLNTLGTIVGKGFRILPDSWHSRIGKANQAALAKAIHAAVFTMKDKPGKKSSNTFHKFAVVATGGVGGFFGIPSLIVELPVSTTIMLRSIADIARSEGEYISSIELKIACVEVFALGGPHKGDDASESGYFAVRAALAQSVTRTAKHIAEKGLMKESAPALARLIMQIAERFSIRVSSKTVAQAIPVIGAAGGALINMLFITHFQNIARGHFIVRRLERKYGEETVRITYKNA